MDDVERLAAIEDIKSLKARYFRLMDTKQWEAWAQVFTDDVVMDVSDEMGAPPDDPEAGIHHGRDTVVAFVSGAIGRARTVHQGHMPEITVTGPDTATGTWAMFDYVDLPGPDGSSAFVFHGYGHYHEEYRRVDGQWCIARLALRRLRVDPVAR